MTAQADEQTDGAISCLKEFFVRYNARDLTGMDSCLHFPHIILGVDDVTIWDGPHDYGPDYFKNFAERTGWHRTVNTGNRVVCVNPNKVHVVVDYVRERSDGSEIARFSNLWILTFSDGRWGIKERSH
jgi:hypothetical protein